MTATSYRTKNGLKVARFRSFGGRFGPGKVHSAFYHSGMREWLVWCVPIEKGPQRGELVDRDGEVTCKRCLNGGAP